VLPYSFFYAIDFFSSRNIDENICSILKFYSGGVTYTEIYQMYPGQILELSKYAQKCIEEEKKQYPEMKRKY
jgi:hypothetical protein